MKYNLLLVIIFSFFGCSQKCMLDKNSCNPTEETMMNIVKGVANTAEFINKNTYYMHK